MTEARGEIARLVEQLAVERIRFEVALAVVLGLHDVIVHPADQTRIIDDVVRRWLALPRAERDRYTAGASGHGAVAGFAWEYLDEVDRAGRSEEFPRTRAARHADSAANARNWQTRLAEISGTASITAG